MLYTGWTDEKQLGSHDEEKCRKLYIEKRDAIQFVKRHTMPFAQGVEEARHYFQQAMDLEKEATKNVGNELDPQLEQEVLECQDDEDLLHPDFVHLNPDNLDFEKDIAQAKKTFRSIEVKTADEMLEEARRLDKFQKLVLNVGINFAQNLIIARKGKATPPKAPLMMVHGGAGSGKSTVINVLSQYIHKILRQDGDDPDCPYVLLAAFTGSVDRICTPSSLLTSEQVTNHLMIKPETRKGFFSRTSRSLSLMKSRLLKLICSSRLI